MHSQECRRKKKKILVHSFSSYRNQKKENDFVQKYPGKRVFSRDQEKQSKMCSIFHQIFLPFLVDCTNILNKKSPGMCLSFNQRESLIIYILCLGFGWEELCKLFIFFQAVWSVLVWTFDKFSVHQQQRNTESDARFKVANKIWVARATLFMHNKHKTI